MEWDGLLCFLLPFCTWPDLVVFHEVADGGATVPLWKARSRAAETPSRHSDSLILGLCRPLREHRKVRHHWLYKTQGLVFTGGRPAPLSVFVASSRLWVQWDSLEGNLVLQNQQEAEEQAWAKGRDQPRPWSSGAICPGCWTPLLLWHVAPN